MNDSIRRSPHPFAHDQFVADVPESCSCRWDWRGGRWIRTAPVKGCVWHDR